MNNQPEIYFARVRPGAILPGKGPENAGYDVFLCLEEDAVRLAPLETRMLPSGIASACSPAYYFQIFERGSTGTKGIAQRCGVIDSGYRDEWFIPLTNLNHKPLYFAKPHMRPVFEERQRNEDIMVYYTDKAVCQAVLLPVPEARLTEVSYETLCGMTSARMFGKLGSTNI